MEDDLNTLKEKIRCLMCKETTEELKILRCYHVFCETCLSRRVKLREDGAAFSCPDCKTTIHLPQSHNFSSLETSGLHTHIHKVLSISTSAHAGPEEPRCSCKKRNPARSYCNTCALYLCEQCFEGHEMLFTEHKILNLRELDDGDYRLLFRQSTFCEKPLHSKEMLKLYCNTCKRPICHQCLLQDHQGLHDISDIETVAQTQNEALRDNLRELEIKEAEETRNLEVSEEQMEGRKLKLEDAKTHAIKTADELIAFIVEKKRVLIRQIEEELSKVDERKEERECLLRQIGSAKEHLYKLTEYATSSQIVNCNDSIKERLEELRVLQTNLSEADCDTEFIPSEAVHKLQEFGIGSFMKVKPDALKSTLNVETGLGDLEALKKAVLSILLKDSKGRKLNNCRVGNIEVSIDPKKDVKHLQISENTGGKCFIGFIPKVPGHFTVSAKVNGHHMCNSPMGLDVKPQELKVTGEFMMTGMDEPLEGPCAIAVNKPNSKIAMAGWKSNCIAVFNIEGELLNKIQITGEGCTQPNRPHDVAFLNDNDIVVADWENHRIVIFDTTTGRVLKCFGREGEGIGEFYCPRGVHADDQGRIIVCDATRVQVLTGDGTYQFRLDMQLLGEDFSPFTAVSNGNVLLASDICNQVIHVVELQDGNSVSRRCTIGEPGGDDGELGLPAGLAIDSDDNVLVCESANRRIQKFTMDGRFVGKTHQDMNSPLYLTTLADGRVLFTSTETNSIAVVQ